MKPLISILIDSSKTTLTLFFLALYLGGSCARAQQIGTVFVIDLENRNWTPSVGSANQLSGNPAAPYINSLATPGNPNATYVSYATAYHNVLSTASGSNPSIHPSEPNYLWQESGSNFGVANDNDPYGSTNQVSVINTFLTGNPSVSGQNLTGLLQTAGISWASYQEDTQMQNTSGGNGNLSGTLSSTVLPQNQQTVPLATFDNSTSDSSYTNPYNGSHYYWFACKHDGSLFFTDTNGSTTTTANTSTSNTEVSHYHPLQQLATDLANNTVASYNLITPDIYNDMHTALPDGFTYHGTLYTGDNAQVAQGDNFLSIIIPEIEASQAFKNNGVIIIWTDEVLGTNDLTHNMMEMVISPLAKGNAYNVTDDLTHSSDLATAQEIFNITASTSSSYLNDAANPSNTGTGYGASVLDLKDFFVSGVIPSSLSLKPFVTSSIAATGTIGVAFSYSITASNTPTSFNATGLPGGLGINTTTGVISGTPTSTGISTVTLSATNANGTGTKLLTLTVDSSLEDWTTQDIGPVNYGGSGTYNASTGVYTVAGSGVDIWGTTDSFQYLYQPLDGDGQIVARITSTDNTAAYSKAGVMIRETTAAGSRHAIIALFPTAAKGMTFQYRTSSNGSSGNALTVTGLSAPYWVKQTRSGNALTGYYSSDGQNWIQQGAVTLSSLATNVLIGLAVTSENNSALDTSTFDNVMVTPAWTSQDIGSVGVMGSASEAPLTSTFTVVGSGVDIYNTNDSFHYDYQTVTGDCQIISKVLSIDNITQYSKAGIMIRETTAAGSRHCIFALFPANGLTLQYRTTTNGASGNAPTLTGLGIVAPEWVKLVRSGNVFTGSYSSDGVTWTTPAANNVTITMASQVLVGLAVTSEDNTVGNTATFNNVTYQQQP